MLHELPPLSLAPGADSPAPERVSAEAVHGVDRQALLAHFDGLLQPERFKDYGPNGLQVEGRPMVRRIVRWVSAVTAIPT